MIFKDGGRIVRKFPFVPGIDFSGTVLTVKMQNLKKMTSNFNRFRVGEAFFGGFSQYAKVRFQFFN